jgi:hypothetical protein
MELLQPPGPLTASIPILLALPSRQVLVALQLVRLERSIKRLELLVVLPLELQLLLVMRLQLLVVAVRELVQLAVVGRLEQRPKRPMAKEQQLAQVQALELWGLELSLVEL